MLCGIPATLGALFVNPPLAMLLGIATFVAWRVGVHKEAEAEFDRHSEELHAANEKAAKLQSEVTTAALEIEQCIASVGWQLMVREYELRTSDFREFHCAHARYGEVLPPDVYRTRFCHVPELWQALRWARALRRRGLVPRLSTISKRELIVTLTFADDSGYDPCEALATRCVQMLRKQLARPRS